MPNWCQNFVSISHDDPALIKTAIEAISNPLNDRGLFSAFMPCPEFEDDGWYMWRVENWGTKWDVTSEDVYPSDDGRLFTAHFVSAWSPPIAGYQGLEKLGFKVEASYHEPGMRYYGTYRDGEDDCREYASYFDVPVERVELFGLEPEEEEDE